MYVAYNHVFTAAQGKRWSHFLHALSSLRIHFATSQGVFTPDDLWS